MSKRWEEGGGKDRFEPKQFPVKQLPIQHQLQRQVTKRPPAPTVPSPKRPKVVSVQIVWRAPEYQTSTPKERSASSKYKFVSKEFNSDEDEDLDNIE